MNCFYKKNYILIKIKCDQHFSDPYQITRCIYNIDLFYLIKFKNINVLKYYLIVFHL